MEAIPVLTAVVGALGVVDKLYNQLKRFSKDEPDPPAEQPHSAMAKRSGNEIHFVSGGQVFEKVTADELTKLDAQSQQLIIAIQTSMNQQFNLWTQIYPKRNESPDPLVNAKVKEQLKGIGRTMCGDLGKILSFLERDLHKSLQDHYGAIRSICSDVDSMAS